METTDPPQPPPPTVSDNVTGNDDIPNFYATPNHSSPPKTIPEPSISKPHLNDISEPINESQPASEAKPELAPAADNGPPPPKKRRRRKKLFTDMISTSAGSGFRVLRPHPKPSTVYSYSETELADEPDDGKPHILHRRRGGGTGGSNSKLSDLAKEVDIEALIAISVGFPVDSLTEEEIEANVVSQIGGDEQANYIVVRNHILARWRSNVSLWLTKDHALESIRAEHKALVSSAYNFLLHHGYINFGLSPAIKEMKLKPPEGAPKANVIVIGAGLSGLVAARQLIFLGFKVVVLEGRARPGGRVRTKKMSGDKDDIVAAADLGGSVLTGINGNPLGVLARQLGVPLHKEQHSLKDSIEA